MTVLVIVFFVKWFLFLFVLDLFVMYLTSFVRKIGDLCRFIKLSEYSFDITWHHVALCAVVFSRFFKQVWPRYFFSVRTNNPLHWRQNLPRSYRYRGLNSCYRTFKMSFIDRRRKREKQAAFSHHELSPSSSPLTSKSQSVKIRQNASALNQWHTKLKSQVLFNAAWTHIHLKTFCLLLDGCFSSFVVSNKYINHCGKRISSHLMAHCIRHTISFYPPVWFISHRNIYCQ